MNSVEKLVLGYGCETESADQPEILRAKNALRMNNAYGALRMTN